VCDQGVCRVEGFSGTCGAIGDGGIDSDPLADDDGDGIMNASDNCPKAANPMQENEDGDARGDICDRCPVDAAPGADDDDDGDGVGNGCDPEPDMRNTFVAFEGFNGTSAGAGWTVTGAWAYGHGRAQSNNGTNQRGSITWAEPVAESVSVSAQFTINVIDAAAPLGFAGVSHHAASPDETRCALSVAAGANGNLELARGSIVMRMPAPVMPGITAVTYTTRQAGNYFCGEAITEIEVAGGFVQGSAAQAGFTELGMNVSLDWITIISRAP
jgi:hypothetical protein